MSLVNSHYVRYVEATGEILYLLSIPPDVAADNQDSETPLLEVTQGVEPDPQTEYVKRWPEVAEPEIADRPAQSAPDTLNVGVGVETAVPGVVEGTEVWLIEYEDAPNEDGSFDLVSETLQLTTDATGLTLDLSPADTYTFWLNAPFPYIPKYITVTAS